MGSEEVVGSVIKCPSCGAALEASPDALVYVCPYCGWAGYEKGAVAFEGFTPSPEDNVVKDVLEFLSHKFKGEVRVREAVTFMLPFWAIGLRARTRYNGYRTELRGSGKQRERIYFPVKGELDETELVPVYARSFESFFGLEEIRSRVVENYSLASGIDPLTLVKLVRILNVEMSEEEAVDYAKTKVSEEHRKRVESLANKVFDCYTESQLLSKRLVFYPVTLLKYEHKGKVYRVCSDASAHCEPKDRVLKAELPMTALTRVYYAIASDAVVALLALASIPVSYILESGSWERGTDLAIPVLLLLGLSGFAGWKGASMATKEERVWRRGSGGGGLVNLEELKGIAEKASEMRGVI